MVAPVRSTSRLEAIEERSTRLTRCICMERVAIVYLHCVAARTQAVVAAGVGRGHFLGLQTAFNRFRYRYGIEPRQDVQDKGVVFVTLEDETWTVNVIVWKSLQSRLLAVYGQWQREGEVRHLVAQHLVDAAQLLGRLAVGSRDFR